MTKDDKPDAWMPLYIGDWDSGTRHLDCEQDGAYGRLVRYYWRNGPLPDDDAQLARIVGMPLARWRKQRPVIAAFFTVSDGRWTQKRIDAELVKWSERKAKAIARAEAAAAARWTAEQPDGPKPKGRKRDATSIPQAVLDQCPSSSSSKVRGKIDSPLTLTEREGSDERAGGSSPPCAQPVKLEVVWDEAAESERARQAIEERKTNGLAMQELAAQLGGRKRRRT